MKGNGELRVTGTGPEHSAKTTVSLNGRRVSVKRNGQNHSGGSILERRDAAN